MLRKKTPVLLAAVLGTMLLVSTAQATPSAPAVTFTNSVSTTVTNSDETDGWAFQVNGQISVTQLGVFDSGQDGLATSHEVGIWNSSGVLLASGTVASGTTDALINQFRYVDIAPLLLGSGTYNIGALWNGQPSQDDYIANTTNFQTSPGVTYLSAWYTPNSPALTLTDASAAFPNNDANFFSNGIFGPNFVSTPVPEPGTMMLLGAGFLGLAVYGKRRKSA